MNKEYLVDTNFTKDVKEALNQLIDKYQDTNSYVVFDFDNTCSIFDSEEQLAIYQLETLAFKLEPANLKEVLKTDLSALNKDLSYTGLIKGSYNDLIEDIYNAYDKLWKLTNGLKNVYYEDLKANIYHQEFKTKMRLMYDVVVEVEDMSVACSWILYWFKGFRKSEVYDLAYKCFAIYSKKESKLDTWNSPKEIKSNIGAVSVSFYEGVSVSDDIKELFKAFKENNIDIYICSASYIEVIRAAIDYFGLHEYTKGLLALTLKEDNEFILNEYDYEACGYFVTNENNWCLMENKINTVPVKEGKSKAIINALYPIYHKGPIAGFMDSSGDFNFCSEFLDMELVIFFNKANSDLKDNGSLIAIAAMYQKEAGYKEEDTHYYLQGRNENNLRSLRSSNDTIRLNEIEPKLFKSLEYKNVLQYMLENKMSIEEYLNEFNNLANYVGYHYYK